MSQHNRPAPRVGVIIPAGGSGRRMGSVLPKQFLRLGGQPILLRTLRAFERHPAIAEIVVAGPAEHCARIRSMVKRARLRKVIRVVEGGSDRQASVACGLAVLGPGVGAVLVHDAVRPLVEPALISRVVRAAMRWGAATAAAPVRETIQREGVRGYCTETPDRSRLWAVQTPQGFRRRLLERAHREAAGAGYRGTDDASLVIRLGRPVRIVAWEDPNPKITTREDLPVAGLLLALRNVRK